MTQVIIYMLCLLWVLGVVALARHYGGLLWVGKRLGFIDADTPHWLRWIYDPDAGKEQP